MPGGLKENLEFFLGNAFRIDRSEGQRMVYHALDEYEAQNGMKLPDVFDVLNCQEGCNMGSACGRDKNVFEVNHAMNMARKAASAGRGDDYFDDLYKKYDENLKLESFLRRYTPGPVTIPSVTNADMDRAFNSMGKVTDEKRRFDCSACGSETCEAMARKVALRVNIPENCLQNSREKVETEHKTLIALHENNLETASKIEQDVDLIKTYVEKIVGNVGHVNESITGFNIIERKINEIASMINIIAINASIEAAKAGQAGKAFNVIASEIQNLARASKDVISQNHKVFSAAESSMTVMNEMISKILEIVSAAFANIQEINRANASDGM